MQQRIINFQILMNVEETMVGVVKCVATPMAHMNAVVTVGMNFSEMLGNVKVLKINDYLIITILTLTSDIDECITGTHNCSGLAVCENEIGFFHCICPGGYRLDDSQASCIGTVTVDSYYKSCMYVYSRCGKTVQMLMSVLKVLQDVVRSVLTQLETLLAHVLKATSCFLMERYALVCGCRTTKDSSVTACKWLSQITVCTQIM